MIHFEVTTQRTSGSQHIRATKLQKLLQKCKFLTNYLRFFFKIGHLSHLFHHLCDLSAVIRLTQCLTFVVGVLALAECYFEFSQTVVIDEHTERDNRFAGVLGGFLEFAQFAFGHQEFAIAEYVMVGITAELVLGYMHLFGIELAAHELAIGVSETGFGLAYGLYFRAAELDAGYVALDDLVVERGTTILDIYFALKMHLC